MKRALMRQAWNGVAVFSVFNLAGMAALTGVLAAKGALSRDRMRQMVAVLRGEFDGKVPISGEDSVESSPAPQATEPASTPHLSEPLMTMTSGSPLDQSRTVLAAQEMAMRQKQRFEAEVQQRLALANSVLLDIAQKREALKAEREAFERQKQQVAVLRDEEGFKKELDVFNTLKPAQAFDYLARKDAAQAARILMAMDSRTAAKILEAARSPEQKQKADEILTRMREVAPAKADAAASTGLSATESGQVGSGADAQTP